MPKTHYHASGKFKVVPLVIATVLAMSASIGAAIYYHTTVVKTLFFSGDNLFGLLLDVGLFVVFYLFKRFNHCRNMAINVGIGTLVSGAAMYFK